MNYIREYTKSTNNTAQEAFDFIFKHRRDVPKLLLKEMMLNYRTYFKTEQKARIVNDYKQLIISKSQNHTSDIAIGYNIVKYVKINETDEKDIINYLYHRIGNHLSTVNVHFLRKRLVLEHIENNILIKRRS
jgi:hypothetical protein